MTRAMEQSMDTPARVLRLPRVQARTGPGAEYDLCASGQRELSPTDPARRARRRLDRVRSGCVDPRTDRCEPQQCRVI